MPKGRKVGSKFPHSEETKRKIGLANSKIKLPIRGIVELSYARRKGVAVCDVCRKKREVRYDTAHKIISGRNKNICNACSHTGKKYSAETNKKKGKKKERNCKWKGGISNVNNILRGSAEYKKWRKEVFMRDHYTCVECGTKSGKGINVYLEAHHINPFSICKDLIFDINNGITLCKNCHKKKHQKNTAFSV